MCSLFPAALTANGKMLTHLCLFDLGGGGLAAGSPFLGQARGFAALPRSSSFPLCFLSVSRYMTPCRVCQLTLFCCYASHHHGLCPSGTGNQNKPSFASSLAFGSLPQQRKSPSQSIRLCSLCSRHPWLFLISGLTMCHALTHKCD